MSKIFNHRRCGNTTRQVDEWVQKLFEDGEAIIIDHAHREGNFAQKHAMRILFERLHREHSIPRNKLKWDEKSKTLTLIPFHLVE